VDRQATVLQIADQFGSLVALISHRLTQLAFGQHLFLADPVFFCCLADVFFHFGKKNCLLIFSHFFRTLSVE
ncbi:hypothetical protein, partial [Xenorhabdus innexi]|uniref:hypothetical protein n=1 Tax=Xenorhabdus innexi TaxID=290109 RepID=UPI001C96A9DA